jgi:hypothetical protein
MTRPLLSTTRTASAFIAVLEMSFDETGLISKL